MKSQILNYLIFLFMMSAAIFACDFKENGETKNGLEGGLNFGKDIDEAGSIPATDVVEFLDENDSSQMKIKGIVKEVCQKKGCWIKMDIGNGKIMQVTFKDYGFFVPKDAAGKIAILQGVVKREISSVETLKHYAEDAGKSKEEVNAIIQPVQEIVFVAEGVILM